MKNKAWSVRAWSVVFLLVGITAQAETALVFYVKAWTGSSLNRKLTLKPPPGPAVYGTNFVYGGPVQVTPTNGIAQVSLMVPADSTADWTVTWEGLAGVATIRVPDTNVVVDASTIVVPGGSAAVISSYYTTTQSEARFWSKAGLLNGTNVTYRTNDGVVYIDASGGSSVDTNTVNTLAAEQALAATNGLGSAAWSASTDFDAAGAAQAATNGLSLAGQTNDTFIAAGSNVTVDTNSASGQTVYTVSAVLAGGTVSAQDATNIAAYQVAIGAVTNGYTLPFTNLNTDAYFGDELQLHLAGGDVQTVGGISFGPDVNPVGNLGGTNVLAGAGSKVNGVGLTNGTLYADGLNTSTQAVGRLELPFASALGFVDDSSNLVAATSAQVRTGLGTASAGDTLGYDGANWTNGPPAAGSVPAGVLTNYETRDVVMKAVALTNDGAWNLLGATAFTNTAATNLLGATAFTNGARVEFTGPIVFGGEERTNWPTGSDTAQFGTAALTNLSGGDGTALTSLSAAAVTNALPALLTNGLVSPGLVACYNGVISNLLYFTPDVDRTWTLFRSGNDLNVYESTLHGGFVQFQDGGKVLATGTIYCDGFTNNQVKGAAVTGTDANGNMISGNVTPAVHGGLTNANDVTITSLTAGDHLAWDSGSSKWTNGQPAAGVGGAYYGPFTNTTIYGGQYRTNAAYMSPGGLLVSNAAGGVVLSGGNVTAGAIISTNGGVNNLGNTEFTNGASVTIGGVARTSWPVSGASPNFSDVQSGENTTADLTVGVGATLLVKTPFTNSASVAVFGDESQLLLGGGDIFTLGKISWGGDVGVLGQTVGTNVLSSAGSKINGVGMTNGTLRSESAIIAPEFQDQYGNSAFDGPSSAADATNAAVLWPTTTASQNATNGVNGWAKVNGTNSNPTATAAFVLRDAWPPPVSARVGKEVWLVNNNGGLYAVVSLGDTSWVSTNDLIHPTLPGNPSFTNLTIADDANPTLPVVMTNAAGVLHMMPGEVGQAFILHGHVFADGFGSFAGLTNTALMSAPIVGTDANGKLIAGNLTIQTNANNTGVITAGQTLITNLTGNISLGGFSGLVTGRENYAAAWAFADSSTRTVALPAGCVSTDGDRTYYVTNATGRKFQFTIIPGVWTNCASVASW